MIVLKRTKVGLVIQRFRCGNLVRRKAKLQVDSKVNCGEDRRRLLWTGLHLDCLRGRRPSSPYRRKNLVFLIFKSFKKIEFIRLWRSSFLLFHHLLHYCLSILVSLDFYRHLFFETELSVIVGNLSLGNSFAHNNKGRLKLFRRLNYLVTFRSEKVLFFILVLFSKSNLRVNISR